MLNLIILLIAYFTGFSGYDALPRLVSLILGRL